MVGFILWVAYVLSSIFVRSDCTHNSATISHNSWEDGSAQIILTLNDDTNVSTKVWTIDGETRSVIRSNEWPRYITGEFVIPQKENGWVTDYIACH